MKVLVYAINGKGMGHLNRTLVLARAMREHAPHMDIRFAVGSPFFGLVSTSGFDVIKIPDRHHTLGYHSSRAARDSHLASVFGCLLDEYRPDVFMVDLAVDERLFREVHLRHAKVALVFRKQRPEAIAQYRRSLGIRRVERFLIPHEASESPLDELPRSWRKRCRHLGPVAKTLDPSRIEGVRARFASRDEQLVMVTTGGGGYPESQRMLDAANEVSSAERRNTRWVIVYGPYYPREIPPSDSRVTRVRFENDLLELMSASDVVVCHAGYNTVRELELAGTPAVIVPLASTGKDDQHARAEDLQAQRKALICDASRSALQTLLERALGGELPRRQPTSGNPNPELGRRLVEALQT